MNKTIAYIVSNPGVNDARVIKMAHAAAKEGYNVHLFGTLKPGFSPFEEIENITFYRYEWKPINILFDKSFFFKVVRVVNKKFAIYLAKKLLPYVKYSLFSSVFADEISKINPDIIHAHDLICLPTAKNAATKSSVPFIYDAHELEIHRNPPLPWLQKQFVKYIETKYSKNASYVITVGRFVANELAKHLPNAKIEVLYNAPIRNESPYKLRKDLKITDNKKILLYVGKVAMGRGIEDIIKILPSLPTDIIFATVGPSDPKQKELLEKMAEKYKVTSRFTILPPVPYDKVVSYIKEADLGIISVQPVTLSYQYSMPNKLFELSFANVPIISNELDEIEEFLAEHNNGITIDINNTIYLTHYISKLMKTKEKYIMSDDKYENLMQKYSWEKQLEKLFIIYNNTLMKPHQADLESNKSKVIPNVLFRNIKSLDEATSKYYSDDSVLNIEVNLLDDSRVHHSLYELAPIDLDIISKKEKVFITFDVQLSSNSIVDSTPCLLMIKYFKNGSVIGESKIKYFVGSEFRKITQALTIDSDADKMQITFYFDRDIRGIIKLNSFKFINGQNYIILSESGLTSVGIDLSKKWTQDGDTLIVSSYLGNFFVRVPEKYDLKSVPDDSIEIVNYFLFGKIEEFLFNIKPDFKHLTSLKTSRQGSSTLLSFSMGEDSTAALSILPDDTVSYYCKRNYKHYYTPAGAKVRVNEYVALERNMRKIPNLLEIENTLEMIGLAGGMRHGFTNNFGYAAVGILLSEHLNVGTLCLGSVLEQVFLKNGTIYTDIIKLKSSLFNTNKKLLNVCGLFLSLPTGGCSEVITSKICEEGKYKNLAISCPNVDDEGNSCGHCFKCFRKRRLLAMPQRVKPDDNVLRGMQKRPLKSATSILYACKNAGDLEEYFPEYKDLELSFLSKYNTYAIENLVPDELRKIVCDNLHELGVSAMSDDEDIRLRSIGKVLNPNEFDPIRAGLESN